MNLRALAAAVITSAVLASCGGADSEQATTIGDVTTTAPKAIKSQVKDPLTPEQMGQALLTVEDLPAGYTKRSGGEEEFEEPTGCEGMDQLNRALETAPLNDEVNFYLGSRSTFVGMGQVVAVHPGEANAVFDRFVKGFSSCTSVLDSSDSGDLRLTLSPLKVPKMGDDTFAIRATGDTFLGSVAADIVVIRADDNIMAISNYGSGPLDESNSYDLARRALDKLNRVAG